MKRVTLRLFLIPISVAMFGMPRAKAQDIYVPLYNPIVPYNPQPLFDRLYIERTQKNLNKKNRRKNLNPSINNGRTGRDNIDWNLSYAPSPSVSDRSRIALLISNLGQGDAFSEMIKKGSFVDLYRLLSSSKGFVFRNVGHTFAASFLVNWAIVNNRYEEYKQGKLDGVLPEVRASSSISFAATIGNLPDSELQLFDEKLMLNYVMAVIEYGAATAVDKSIANIYADQSGRAISALREKIRNRWKEQFNVDL